MPTLIVDAVKFAQEVLEDILSNIHNQNVEKLIRDAEQILEDIRTRNFDNNILLVDGEFTDALDSKSSCDSSVKYFPQYFCKSFFCVYL